ncbi:hypothetical protein RSAG8_00504, partial [Rhizoctonia solani AG-8 WAC10335]
MIVNRRAEISSSAVLRRDLSW